MSVDWRDAPLREALQDFAVTIDRNLVILPALSDRDAEGITLALKNLPAVSVMSIVQRHHGVFFLQQGDVILATTEADAVARTATLRTYDLSSALYHPPSFPAPKNIGLRPSGHIDDDLDEDAREIPSRFDDPGEVVDLIRRTTGEAQWAFEGVTLDAFQRTLVVKHTPGMHRRIQGILVQLRRF
jgi:hypothetical protein